MPPKKEESKVAKQKVKRLAKDAKERKLGEVIEAVTGWRILIGGISDDIKQPYSPTQAAVIIGIPKKTLDDYLLQIKYAKKYGFEFSQHFNDKIGVLRGFVREHRLKESAAN